jgi:hypothetical protein
MLKDVIFNVPTNKPGNTWSVFKINGRTGILTPIAPQNSFGNASSRDVPNLVPNVRLVR